RVLRPERRGPLRPMLELPTMPTRCSKRSRGALLCVLLVAAFMASTPAASADTPASLLARLEAIRASAHPGVPDGSLVAIEYLLERATNIEGRFAEAAARWRARAARYLEAAEAGRDPYPLEAGKITNRGYHSEASQRLQGYAIYLPPGYDPAKQYPLYVALHGGSS